MGRNKFAFIGCIEYGYNLLNSLLGNNIKIDYIVSLDKEKAKIDNVSGYIDFQDISEKFNIPIYYVDRYDMKSEKDLNFFISNKFDILLPGGWNRLIPDTILNTLTYGSIGVHGSSDFLPRGRGRSPLNWSIIEGKKRFILHLFFMKSGADNGGVFDYEQFDINEFDTIKTLYYKNTILTKNMLIRSLPKILNNSIQIWEQNGEVTYYLKRTADDGIINWKEWDVDKIYNFIRALSKPYPGAFTYINGNKVLIWKAQIFDRNIKYLNAKYGEIVEKFDNDIIINSLSGLLLITQYDSIQLLNKGDIFE